MNGFTEVDTKYIMSLEVFENLVLMIFSFLRHLKKLVRAHFQQLPFIDGRLILFEIQ